MTPSDVAVMMFRCLINLAQEYFGSFELLEEPYHVEVRNTKTDLWSPGVDTASVQRRFSFHGVKVWNSLHENQKQGILTAIF